MAFSQVDVLEAFADVSRLAPCHQRVGFDGFRYFKARDYASENERRREAYQRNIESERKRRNDWYSANKDKLKRRRASKKSHREAVRKWAAIHQRDYQRKWWADRALDPDFKAERARRAREAYWARKGCLDAKT